MKIVSVGIAPESPLIPEPRRRDDGRGRPWKSRRPVLNGILWVLRTGAPWADLPDRYPHSRPVTDAFNNGFAPE
jgi:transposase